MSPVPSFFRLPHSFTCVAAMTRLMALGQTQKVAFLPPLPLFVVSQWITTIVQHSVSQGLFYEALASKRSVGVGNLRAPTCSVTRVSESECGHWVPL